MSDHALTDHHDHGHDHGHDHDHGHGDHHDHGDHGGEHSHKKQYIILGAVLTVVTAVELIVLPDVIGPVFGESLLNWLLVILSVFKLAAVIGIFMHLKDDRRIYSVLFVSPMIIAVLMILILAAMVSLHWDPYTASFTSTTRCIAAGECAKPWEPAPETTYQEQYAVAEQAGFADGKTTYATNCAACHRGDGGGLVGPAFTDSCYIHGGELKDMVTVLHKGVAAKGMPAWEGVLTDTQIDQVAFYIRSMRGASVADAKPCQGDPVQ